MMLLCCCKYPLIDSRERDCVTLKLPWMDDRTFVTEICEACKYWKKSESVVFAFHMGNRWSHTVELMRRCEPSRENWLKLRYWRRSPKFCEKNGKQVVKISILELTRGRRTWIFMARVSSPISLGICGQNQYHKWKNKENGLRILKDLY